MLSKWGGGGVRGVGGGGESHNVVDLRIPVWHLLIGTLSYDVNSNIKQKHIPYFLDFSAPLFSLRPQNDRASCPGLRVILRALE